MVGYCGIFCCICLACKLPGSLAEDETTRVCSRENPRQSKVKGSVFPASSKDTYHLGNRRNRSCRCSCTSMNHYSRVSAADFLAQRLTKCPGKFDVA